MGRHQVHYVPPKRRLRASLNTNTLCILNLIINLFYTKTWPILIYGKFSNFHRVGSKSKFLS